MNQNIQGAHTYTWCISGTNGDNWWGLIIVVVFLVGMGQEFHYHFLLRTGFEACSNMLPNHDHMDGTQNEQAGHDPCSSDLYILEVVR